ncbi:DExH-box ATP-dependent RNA helicase DExH12-like protein, partial [Tanacetum coccineum]
NAIRLMRALYEIVSSKWWARLTKKALNLCESFKLLRKDEDL